MAFKFPKKLPQEWIKQLENLSVNTRFKNMRVAGRDRRGTIVRLGGDAFKILHNGKNQNVFGHPLVGGRGLDPNFGYETKGEKILWGDIGDKIIGSVFTCPEAGTGDSITVYLRNGHYAAIAVKCAIYDHSTSNLLTNGVTEEISIPVAWDAWKTFSFSTPPSLSATDYVLVAWASHVAIVMPYDDGDTNQGHYQELTYNNFPDPLVPTHNNNKHSIYCTYTPVAPPQWRLGIESTPITGVPITIDGVEAGSTPVSTMVSEGDHTVSIPSEQERSKRR